MQAEEVYKRSFWTESFVGWSPHGSYLATMHRQGVALWGGPSFSRLVRFTHPDVRPHFLRLSCRDFGEENLSACCLAFK